MTSTPTISDSSAIPGPMTLLDGGLGRELQRRGAPFRQPEWSALSLLEAPETVAATHLDFIEAGAQVITINSYAVTPFHIGERFYSDAPALITTASDMAADAVRQYQSRCRSTNRAAKDVAIAGCLPPLFGSYRPDLYQDDLAEDIAKPLIEYQKDVADLWLIETASSIKEAQQWHSFISQFDSASATPLWVSFTLDDRFLEDSKYAHPDAPSQLPPATLRSGESVAAAVQTMLDLGVAAMLFNCSQPEVMGAALSTAKDVIESQAQTAQPQLGVYANAFGPAQDDKPANSALRHLRQDTTPDHYLAWALQWQDLGATIIGGCCGIGVEHIARLSDALADD